MRSNKISLIFMKDEGRTHRLRLSTNALCVIAVLLLLMPLLFGVSVWLNIHLYRESTHIKQTQTALQYTVDQNSQTIARLSNLEKFLKDHSPGLLGLLVSQSSVDNFLVPAIESEGDKLAEELGKLVATAPLVEELQKDAKASDVALDAAKVAEAPVQVEPEKDVELVEKSVTDDKSGAPLVPLNPAVTEEELPQSIDLGYVNLGNVRVALAGNKISVSYRIENTKKNVSLSGDQVYTLIDVKNGQIERIELSNATDDTFRIKNLKIVNSKVSLPKVAVSNRARLQIDIMREGTILFRETYPISR